MKSSKYASLVVFAVILLISAVSLSPNLRSGISEFFHSVFTAIAGEKQKENVEVSWEASAEDIAKANNMVVLKEGEFAVITKENGPSTGKKITQIFTLSNGQTFRVETDQSSSVEIMEGKAGIDTFVPANDPNVVVHTLDDFDGYDGKTDRAIKRKLSKNETVPVIIQFNLGFDKYFDKKDTDAKRLDKANKFNKARDETMGLVYGGKGKYKNELQIINGISADIDQETLEKLEKHSTVKKIDLDREVKATLDESLDEIHAKDIWTLIDTNNVPITGKGKTIAIIDTGVDYTHADLGGCFGPTCKVIGGYDFVNNDSNPMDDHGHGTHVAATAAGNGLLKGVAPDAKILAYKVLNSGGSGSWANCISAIQRATDPNNDGNPADHADVASMSLGGSGNPDDAVSLAVDNSSAAGVVHTIAAGNSGGASTIGSPGTARTAITVAAACKASQIGVHSYCSTAIASFSSKGPLIWNGEDIKKPDVSAPGVMICAARWDSYGGTTCFDSQHHRISGTSMATPHVAGAAALVLQAYPGYTPEAVKQTLKSTARSLGLSYDYQGAGEIDLKNAIPFSPKLNITPGGWTINSDPTQKTNTIQQSFSVTPVVTDINNLNVSFQLSVAGVGITSNKTILSVANKTTDSFIATVNIDNDVAVPSMYYGNIVLSESGITKGIIPITLVVKPTLTSQTSLVDYGLDDPTVSSWTSDLRLITLNNLRKDASQTVTITSSGLPTGVAIQAPSSVTIPAGGTSNIETRLNVDNTKVANNSYTGKISITNSVNQLSIAAKFIKFYVFTVQAAEGQKMERMSIHDRVSAMYYLYSAYLNPTSTFSLYLSAAGPYDALILFKDIVNSTSSNSVSVFRENILINQASTTIVVNNNEAKNKLILTATDSAGVNQSPLLNYSCNVTYLPKSTLYFSVGNSDYVDVSLNYLSNISTNYKFDCIYTWPSRTGADKIHYIYHTFTGLDKDVTLTNTASDFKKMDIQFDVDQQSGSLQTIIGYSKGYPAYGGLYSTIAIPVTQTIYSMLPENEYYFLSADNGVTSETIYAPFFTIGDSPKMWWSFYSFPSYTIPIANNKLYNGLGPSYWSARLNNTATSVVVHPYLSYLGWTAPLPALLRQDYTIKNYDTFNYQIYKDGTLTATGNIPKHIWGSMRYFCSYCSISSVNLPQAGQYELKASFPYKNKGLDMTGSVLSSFNTSLSDPNPPAIKRLLYFSNNARSEVYDKTVGNNRIEFELDPIGGTMTGGSASYSLDGNTFTSINVTGTNGVYTANVPTGLAVTSILTLRIEGTDNSNNLLSYTFQLPVGTAPNPPNPPPSDTTPPTVSMTAPANGSTVSGNVTVSANASDDKAVSKVEFYRDTGTLISTDPTYPYSITWDSTSVTNGTHTLYAKAYDTSNNSSTSASVSVTVSNAPSDTTPPTVSITSPPNGFAAKRKSVVVIAATATDNVGVTKVDFYVNNSLTCTDTAAPYYCTWSVPAAPNKTYQLQARAYDAKGNVGTSATISVISSR